MPKIALLAVVVTALVSLGAAPPPAEKPAEAFERLRNEAFASRKLQAEFGPRFAAHARKYPDDPTAIEALLLAAVFGEASTDDLGKQALERLENHYAKSPLVLPLLRNLGLAQGRYESAFLMQIGDTNPDKRIRALAWRAMINGRSSYIQMHQKALSDDAGPRRFPPDYVKKVKADLTRWEKEVEQARAKLKSPDLVGAFADVSVGAKAPATEAVDLAGKKVSLADHRGKVVVLDFWHTRCGPCRKMIPGTNALIEELKGKPFVQVGISTDPGLETVNGYLKTTTMPWEHWWVGGGAKQLETWDVEAYPTVYVIDHEGVIRHRQVGFDPEKNDLHDLIRALVKKAEAAQGSR